MRRRSMFAVPTLSVVLVLALSGAAPAGGWATVELDSSPDGVAAGEKWPVELTVLQHGRTPLDGVKPEIAIVDRRTGASRRFAARPAGRPGVYRAQVVFPAAGKWEYSVHDGFSQVHAYPAATIRSAPALQSVADRRAGTGSSNGSPAIPLAAALVVAGVAAAGLTFAARRRRIVGRA